MGFVRRGLRFRSGTRLDIRRSCLPSPEVVRAAADSTPRNGTAANGRQRPPRWRKSRRTEPQNRRSQSRRSGPESGQAFPVTLLRENPQAAPEGGARKSAAPPNRGRSRWKPADRIVLSQNTDRIPRCSPATAPRPIGAARSGRSPPPYGALRRPRFRPVRLRRRFRPPRAWPAPRAHGPDSGP